ncbi:MAG: transketolase C-terminal domain-containing protein [Candidatus Margulisbacteria bacterium]|nr:transketolase C-terminal domain-containing protein [Candidatus Margulisiibacteriota bacterium]
MRNAFVKELLELVKQNDKIVVLSADIGNRMFDRHKEYAPDRFYNCGVAEANMISLAAGMALSGLVPVAYTIAPFITIRCLEQIKIDICYHNVPVVLIGTGSGLSYAELGPTHHSLDDIALLRCLPNMTVIAPGDPVEAALALRAAVALEKPVYIRIGKKGEPAVHQTAPDLVIGKGLVMNQGEDVCLLSTGNVLPESMGAAARLQRAKISAQVISCHTIKPLDDELLKKIFAKFKYIVTVEEHGLVGGLGSAVCEWAADNRFQNHTIIRCGSPDRFLHKVGSQEHYRREFGLTAETIENKIRKELAK